MPRSKRPIRPEDFYRLRFVSDPQISPCGAWVACVLSQADRQKDRMLSDVWLIATKGRRRIQLTNRHHRDSAPRWSPDGSRIAFLAPEKDDDKAKPQLWVIPVGGGEARRITQLKQGAASPVWSPDGRTIAFLARDPKPEDDEPDPKKPKIQVAAGRIYATDVKVTDRIRYRSSDFPPRDERRHIHLVPARGGQPRRLTHGDCDDSQPAWSPDGKHIAFVSTRARDPDWDLVGDVSIVPVRGGKPRRLSTLAGGASAPAWSPDGRHVAYVGSPVPEVYRPEYRLWVQPARGGRATSLTESLEGMPHAAHWSPDGRAIYFLYYGEGFESLWRVGLNNAPERVLPEERCIDAYSVAARAGSIAFRRSTPEHPADLFLCDADGGGERRLTDHNRAVLSRLRLGKTESFRCRSFDGTRIHAWMVKPPGFRPGRRYPLVLNAHGGPYWAFFESWMLHTQVLAAQGYLVVYANPRGSTGYGRKFQTAVVANWGPDDSRDYLAAADHVIRQGHADRSRMGIMGGSYGGFMTVWLLATTDRFKAGVAECAATDEAMFYYSADMPLWSEQELGGPPWERPDDYRRVSPSAHAHRIRAPLLLLHAEDDLRVPIPQSEIVHTTVKRIGVESVFVRYPSGGHGFSGSAPRFVCDTLNRTLDWFDRHLKGAPRHSPAARKLKRS